MKSYDKNKYRQRAAKNTPWLKFVPFRVSRNTHTRNYRKRHPFAMKPIANERG